MRPSIGKTRWWLAAACVLMTAVPALGQGFGGGAGGGGGGGGGGSAGGSGFTGGSGGMGGGQGATANFGAGSTGTMIGGTGFTGGSATGTTQGGAGGAGRAGASSATTVPSSFNPFRGNYVNPMAKGMPSGTGTQIATTAAKAFGQPLYATVTTGQGGAGQAGFSGRTGGLGAARSGTGFTTTGYRNNAPYVALPHDMPRPEYKPMDVVADLRGIVERTPVLNASRNVSVDLDGAVIVLRGTVSSERERRLVEGMVSLNPGVRAVRNELQVQAAKKE